MILQHATACSIFYNMNNALHLEYEDKLVFDVGTAGYQVDSLTFIEYCKDIAGINSGQVFS